jgi:uncharacterized protein YndB with AHSA1/START domain
MSEVESDTVRLERTFDAPADDVFNAWTNPEVLRRWWEAGPSFRATGAEVDLRVGGRYRLAMENAETGEAHIVGGEYYEVRPPSRLVYSWAWEDADGRPGEASTVTVEFAEADGRTTVVLEHAGLTSDQSRADHTDGWVACLDTLAARVFAAPVS